jgi:hypothetical protein
VKPRLYHRHGHAFVRWASSGRCRHNALIQIVSRRGHWRKVRQPLLVDHTTRVRWRARFLHRTVAHGITRVRHARHVAAPAKGHAAANTASGGHTATHAATTPHLKAKATAKGKATVNPKATTTAPAKTKASTTITARAAS